MTFISYAQNFEDVVLWRALRDVGRGFYIDVGAAHPDTDSVTRAFHERGWHGINIEPVPDYVRRLRASRPNDITLGVAASDRSGTAELLVVAGTGLSSFDGAHLPGGAVPVPLRVATATLAEICRTHAPADIHFLKIDVEGAERQVLQGADFTAFRPWVVVVEATEPLSSIPSHDLWEGLLLAAEYRFVLFDGLNRFYVAAEHHAALAPRLSAPANITDDFLRVADGEWTRRVADAESQTRLLAARLREAEARSEATVARLHATELDALASVDRAEEAEALAGRRARALAQREQALTRAQAAQKRAQDQAQAQAQAAEERAQATQERAQAAHGEVAALAGQALAAAAAARDQAERAAEWLGAMRASSSWRLTAPLRAGIRLLRGRRARPPAQPAPVALPAPVPAPMLAPPPALAHPAPPGTPPIVEALPAVAPGGLRRTVHQFHPGVASGDAITQAMLLTRSVLRGLGYVSDIFVEHRPDGIGGGLRDVDELPLHDDYVLILRHSLGYDRLAKVLDRPAPKVLHYHNITPPALLGEDAFLRHYAELGRAQLGLLRGQVAACLADSEYNALELRRLDFPAPQACALLFDVEAMLDAAAKRASSRGRGPFTVLFVGRLVASKGQDELVDAFAAFRRRFDAPARLVLVGRDDVGAVRFGAVVRARAEAQGVTEAVTLTGPVDDAVLHDWYATADLYVSLSHHEGFGVPLIEAACHGLPVLAWPAGAVPETLGDGEGLLTDRAPDAVATRILALARDPRGRAQLAERQRRQLDRFRLDRQVPLLIEALLRAGAAPPARPAVEAALCRAMRFTVTGHVNKTYSLAAINRDLALSLEAERPGSVRLAPVETVPTSDLSEVPAELREAVAALALRPAHASGPEVVISQHYPVYLPDPRGDVCLALFFWEESLVPADTVARLNRGFRAVLAPSRFVAKALIDSGVAIPVHVVGTVPRLGPFEALAAARAARAAGASGDAARPFTFLHVSSGFPRKGVDVLLAAYARRFRQGDRVRLVLKLFDNPHNDAAGQIARLRAADPRMAPVELLTRDLDAADLRALYAEADAMVLPSRGEGFNLPAAEAMAAGLPLIVTGAGGHRDFCGPGTARLIDWRFAPSRSHLATPHSVWIEPDMEDLAAALGEAASDPAAAASRVLRARAAAARHFSRARMVEALTQAAARALLAPLAPVRLGWISTWQVQCGIAEYSRHLLAAMPRRQLDGITVFADQRSAARAEDDDGLAVRPAWQGGHPRGVGDLLKAIAQVDPHVVVLQHQPGLFGWDRLAALLVGLGGARCVVTLHNTRDLLDVPAYQRSPALAALAGCARVLVHTVADLNRLKNLGLIDNVALLPHGALRGFAGRPPRILPESVPDGGPVIGSYGFFLPGKGIAELIEALAILRRRWPGARLRLVNAAYGGVESETEIGRCRALATRAGLADAVAFHTEYRADFDSLTLLAGCDVLALPYQHSKEASSAALRMVLAAGVPALVTDLPLFEEAGEAVARSAGLDSQSVAESLARLLDDPARRAALQRAAREWLDLRQWEAIAQRLHGMLLGLSRRPAASEPARADAGVVALPGTAQPAAQARPAAGHARLG